MDQQENTLSQDWTRYRDHAGLKRAEKFARYTDPALMQDPLSAALEFGDQPDAVHRDWQSLGAVLLNNLAAKMTGMLFPSNQPNFQLVASDSLKQYAADQGWDDAAMRVSMANTEQAASQRLYYGNSYVKLQRAVKLCIAVGDCVMYRDSGTGSFVVWNRHSYSIRRDPFGRVVKCIIKQRFRQDTVPRMFSDDIQRVLKGQDRSDDIELYTQVEFTESSIQNMPRVATITHEVDGVILPNAVSVFPEHLCPIFFPTWTIQDGEHYGRGLVETMSGDFSKLSALSEQLALYELDSLSMLNVVEAGAAQNVDDYRKALTGEFVVGPANAITAYDRGDYNKINAIQNDINTLSQRLAQAFMYSGVQRDSERTTALEVSLVAKEADQALGGAYSQLAESMQTPAAYLALAELGDDVANALLNHAYRPTIMTGVQALSRSSTTQKMLAVAQYVQAIVPVLVQVDQTLDATKLTQLIATNEGVSFDDAKKSAQQLQQEAEAKQQQAAAQSQAATALIQNATDAQAAVQQ